MTLWRVTIYRTDSHTPVVYELVKHAWWESDRYIVSVLKWRGSRAHYYWTWPRERISHIREECADG